MESSSTLEAGVNQGDLRVVRELFVEHGPAIHRYAARRVGPDLADDVVAETFRRVIESYERFDPARGTHRGWLYGIATNVLHKHRRSEARRLRALLRAGAQVAPQTDPLLAPTCAIDAERELTRVLDAIEGLPVDDVDLLVLVAWEQMSRAEVAEVLGIPVGTVRSRLHRIRSVLDRARFDGEGSAS